MNVDVESIGSKFGEGIIDGVIAGVLIPILIMNLFLPIFIDATKNPFLFNFLSIVCVTILCVIITLMIYFRCEQNTFRIYGLSGLTGMFLVMILVYGPVMIIPLLITLAIVIYYGFYLPYRESNEYF